MQQQQVKMPEKNEHTGKKTDQSSIEVFVTDSNYQHYAPKIAKQIEESAQIRGTGIAKRSVDYLQEKINNAMAIMAIDRDTEKLAGFIYIEAWEGKQYVANSGLIIFPEFRGLGLANKIKQKAFQLSRSKFPKAKLFGLTTNPGVMKINSKLGYIPVNYEQLTTDPVFWDGCQSCVNYSILQSKQRKQCICTAMLYDPQKDETNQQRKTNQMKVVVAFSGGLDTSFCMQYLLNEMNYEVHTVTVNTGGFSQKDLVAIERQAKSLGAATHQTIDATNDFYHECVKYLIFGNVLKNNTYPLCVSAERAFQAYMVAKAAKELNAKAIAHGSTGAGNDQIRFDLMFQILCPDIKIVTPIRDQKLTRKEEQAYLQKHGISCSEEVASYSINQGLWGTSVGGNETLTSHMPLPEEAWPTPMSKNIDDKENVKITFHKGEPIAINDEADNPVSIIQSLQSKAQPYGIGRDIHIGDTLVNIKGRVGFEAAAPMILIRAHHTLEKHTLTKAQLKTKDQLAQQYGELVHEGQFLEPALRDIEALFSSSQKRVSGDVYVQLAPWHMQILGCSSDYDLMKAESSHYGESNVNWDGRDVKGLTRILSNQIKTHYQLGEH